MPDLKRAARQNPEIVAGVVVSRGFQAIFDACFDEDSADADAVLHPANRSERTARCP
jgi:hypothetical protein